MKLSLFATIELNSQSLRIRTLTKLFNFCNSDDGSYSISKSNSVVLKLSQLISLYTVARAYTPLTVVRFLS